jgi:hypothetical protein
MMHNIEWAKNELQKLEPKNKYKTMIYTAAVITKLLEGRAAKPIIVGGLSVEIYTNQDYSTRDIDFVTMDIKIYCDMLYELGFKRDKRSARHLYHEELQISIEFPDDELVGDYDKISKLTVDEANELYVYVISPEDIIMDRLRAKLYWKDDDSKRWGMYILAHFHDSLDLEYMLTLGRGAENFNEVNELKEWLRDLENLRRK